MRSTRDERMGELTGDLAPPMANGEVIFDAPWQGRVFGIARSLSDAGYYTWDEFRAYLIDALREVDDSSEFVYYTHFQQALEALLQDKNIVLEAELDQRATDFAARPHDHDH